MRHNEFGQPIGNAVPGFTPGERPGRPVLQGRFCRLERLSAARHGEDLYAFHGPDTDHALGNQDVASTMPSACRRSWMAMHSSLRMPPMRSLRAVQA